MVRYVKWQKRLKLWYHESVFYDHTGVKLSSNNRKKSGKFTNMWKLSETLSNNQWVKEEITRETRKLLGMSKNENSTYQNWYNEGTTVVREKLIAVNTYNKKEGRSEDWLVR